MARWGGDFDPVRVAVDEAIASFSTKNPDADRRIWLKIANRVGAEAFMDAVWQKRSEIGHDRILGGTLQKATRKLRVVRVGLRQMDGIGFCPHGYV